jgi:hypothetical protein
MWASSWLRQAWRTSAAEAAPATAAVEARLPVGAAAMADSVLSLGLGFGSGTGTVAFSFVFSGGFGFAGSGGVTVVGALGAEPVELKRTRVTTGAGVPFPPSAAAVLTRQMSAP